MRKPHLMSMVMLDTIILHDSKIQLILKRKRTVQIKETR